MQAIEGGWERIHAPGFVVCAGTNLPPRSPRSLLLIPAEDKFADPLGKEWKKITQTPRRDEMKLAPLGSI